MRFQRGVDPVAVGAVVLCAISVFCAQKTAQLFLQVEKLRFQASASAAAAGQDDRGYYYKEKSRAGKN